MADFHLSEDELADIRETFEQVNPANYTFKIELLSHVHVHFLPLNYLPEKQLSIIVSCTVVQFIVRAILGS